MSEPRFLCDEDLWNVFELDDETAEAVPEAGDFWGRPDDEPEEV